MQRISRGAVFWGSALVTAGLVILAIQQGLIDEALLADIGQWWPLLLIGAGVAIVFAGALGVVAVGLSGVLLGLLVGGLVSGAATLSVGCGTGEPGAVSAFEHGTFAGDGAQVDLELNCVDLVVAGGGGDDWRVEADEDMADELQVASTNRALELRHDEDIDAALGDRGAVAVTAPGDADTDVSVRLNAGDATFDFSDGAWGELDLEGNAVAMAVDLSGAEAERVELSLNAGAAELQLDEGTGVGSPISFAANAGSIAVCAPEAVGLQVTIGAEVAVGHNLDEQGLEQDGDVWRTEGYASADTQIEIEFSGNAASFTLNPSGGCS